MASITNRLTIILLALCATQGRAAAQQSTSTRSDTPQRRFAADSFWTVAWTRGYDREEDLFIEPRIIAFTRGAVITVDLGTREVLALHPASGRTLLHMTARVGSGPGEIRRPHIIIPVPLGFAVADIGNARLSAFDLKGTLLWDTPLPEPMVGGLCAQSASRIAIKRYSSDHVEIRDTSGALLSVRSVSWGKHSQETLSQGVQVAGPSRKGHCAIIREFGSQFALLHPSGSLRTFKYIEQLPEPNVESSSKVLEKSASGTVRQYSHSTTSKQSGINAMIRGDTLIVRFGGESARRLRLLDYYSMIDGRYLHSRVLPGGFVSITIAPDGMFYGTEIGAEHSGLVALRPSKVPSPPSPPAPPQK